MKLLLIVNTAASSVTARRRVVIHKALSADFDTEVAETHRRGHATRLARGAAATGTDLVVVLGGDGTLNEAANGLAGTRTALAALPGGSTNVFARTLGLPDDPVDATAATLEAIGAGRIERIGLGTVNGRYFLFHCGIGFDAAVVEQVERRGDIKRYLSHALFVYAAIDTWIRHYERRSPAFSVDVGDGTIVDDGLFTIVLNTNPYTYFGSRALDVAPGAALDQPLVVTTLRSLRLSRLLRTATSALRGGGLGAGKWVHEATQVERATLEGYRPMPYQVDGDYLGYVDRLEFVYEPKCLDLVMPRRSSAPPS